MSVKNTEKEEAVASPNQRIINILNSPLILILITGNFLLLQLFLNSTIDAFSTSSMIRLIVNSFLIYGLLMFGENRKWLKVLVASILWGIGFLVLLVIVHIRYFKVVPSLFSLNLLNQVNDIGGSISSLIRYDQIGLFCGLLLCLIFYIFRPIKMLKLKTNTVLAITLCLLVIYPWGKLFYELRISREEVRDQFHMSASNAINKFGYLPYLCYHFIFIQSQLNYGNPLPIPFSQSRKNYAQETKYNFIVLQVESLDRNLLFRKTPDGFEITPILNHLAKNHIYFPNFYAQHSMGGSSDAEISSLTSVLPLSDVSIMTTHDLRHLPSVVKDLKNHGYISYAFHGNFGNFWNRQLAYKQLGFDDFYDSKYYSEGASGWESKDGLFLKESIPYLAELSKNQPFFAYMITISMHNPYYMTVKTKYNKHIKAANRYNASYFQRAAYTDRALGIFLDILKQKGILKDTVVMIYGDHTSDLQNSEYHCGKNASENIPLIIMHPKGFKQLDLTFGSHVDIGPTILDLAGLPANEKMYGRSMTTWLPDRLFPIAISNKNYVVTAFGNLPFEDYYNSAYSDILNFSRSHFYKMPGRAKETNVLMDHRYIAHALGSIADRDYTNSREAFLRTYDLGVRVMEVDFCKTRDNHWVCFHDGMEKRIGTQHISRINRDEFLKKKLDGHFTVLDIEGLLDLLEKFPDVYLVTDTKGDFKESISYITEAVKRRDKDLLKRMIPQIYDPKDLIFIRDKKDFQQVIFTLYRTDMSNKEVIDFTIQNRDLISAVTVDEFAFSFEMSKELLKHKIPLYVHTINSERKMYIFFRQGVFGFYTDLYNPLVNKYQQK